MYKVLKLNKLRPLLAAGVCLGMLVSAEAAWEERAQPDELAYAGQEPLGSKGVLGPPVLMETSEEAYREELQASLRRRIDALLDDQGLTREQRNRLCLRMSGDSALLTLLEQGELTGADLIYLALPNGRAGLLDRYSAWAAERPGIGDEAVVLQVNMDQDQAFYTAVRTTPHADSLSVLVNKHYALPDGFVPQLEVLGGAYGSGSLRPEAARAFRAMADASREDGIALYSVSAYRSFETQTSVYNRYLTQYRQATVDTFSARPGYSEHQTGLALDINVASTKAHFENTPAFAWLKAHCARYGFILRYDQGKKEITGYQFEPWHFRYVGVEAAEVCMGRGLALEEYLALQPVF
ncbi:MAG: M15 family metallopeptidase [Lawsonibacter sp.]|nr:M15 family metallopeptidase [Lawsonibacter sp.]